MTKSDPCYEGCHEPKTCTADICLGLGKIGCGKTQCELMGSGKGAHCMSHMAPKPAPPSPGGKKKKKFPTYGIVLIVIGGFIVLGGAVAAVVVRRRRSLAYIQVEVNQDA